MLIQQLAEVPELGAHQKVDCIGIWRFPIDM